MSNGPTKRITPLIVLSIIGLGFLVALTMQFRAERVHDRGMDQFAGIAEVILVVAVIIGFTIFRAPRKNPDEWLLRLVVVTALGMCVIVLYSVQWIPDRALPIIGVGLLSAGAAWLIAVVVGFLFGIPRWSSAEKATTEFQPSTSFEQVADWLTKIIVGVGLTQIPNIAQTLRSLTSFIAQGMGDSPSHRALAFAIIVYFTSCGLLFGFLWARLYMIEEFFLAGRKQNDDKGPHESTPATPTTPGLPHTAGGQPSVVGPPTFEGQR